MSMLTFTHLTTPVNGKVSILTILQGVAAAVRRRTSTCCRNPPPHGGGYVNILSNLPSRCRIAFGEFKHFTMRQSSDACKFVYQFSISGSDGPRFSFHVEQTTGIHAALLLRKLDIPIDLIA